MSNEMLESDVFVLLAKRRRRLALQVLQRSTTPLQVSLLAERIGDYEHENPTAEDVRTICLTLYHVHLPKLEEASVISCDRNEGTVHPGLNFQRLIRALEAVTEADMPWSDQ